MSRLNEKVRKVVRNKWRDVELKAESRRPEVEEVRENIFVTANIKVPAWNKLNKSIPESFFELSNSLHLKNVYFYEISQLD